MLRNVMKREDILNGVYGLAVGDALGVPVEFCSRESRDNDRVVEMREYGTHNQPKGTWSDDTSMVLATLDSMCAEIFSMGNLMNAFRKWVEQAKYTAGGVVFDIGGTTLNAINRFCMGEDPERCGENDLYGNGNGALMRMLPLIYYVERHYGILVNPAAVNFIYSVAGLTHNHIISKICCLYYVYIGMYIRRYGSELGLYNVIKLAIEQAERFEDCSPVLELRGYNSLIDCTELSRDEIKSTGFVVDSLEAAIWCMCSTDSYRYAVETAVNLGGDTDTIGAIIGSLAGLHYGYEAIPEDWIEALQNKELIDTICNRFYEQYK